MKIVDKQFNNLFTLQVLLAGGLVRGCPECGRGCGLVSGLYTKPHLPPGLSLVTEIPRGACSLNVSLLTPHHNHLGQ